MQKLIMKKRNTKGFTLVEVIVVLVILAILAAILIPSLTGYIDKANERKVIAEARSIYIAAQTVLSEQYGDSGYDVDTMASIAVAPDSNSGLAGEIVKLAEMNGGDFTSCTIESDGNAKITKVVYISGSYTATYDSGNWTVS